MTTSAPVEKVSQDEMLKQFKDIHVKEKGIKYNRASTEKGGPSKWKGNNTTSKPRKTSSTKPRFKRFGKYRKFGRFGEYLDGNSSDSDHVAIAAHARHVIQTEIK